MKRSLRSLFAVLILSASTLQANMSPGPYPADRMTIQVPISDLEKTSPGQTDSTPPVPEARSPVPMVVAGLAATAGVALLGLWIAKKGRSGNAQVQ